MVGKMLMGLAFVSLVELYLLVELGNIIGAMNVIAIVIITAILGVSFARSQGIQILARMQHTINQGVVPGRELMEGAMVMVGAMLLIAPGVITDLIGLTLLFPFSRILYIKIVLALFRKKFRAGDIQVYQSNFDDQPLPDYPSLDNPENHENPDDDNNQDNDREIL